MVIRLFRVLPYMYGRTLHQVLAVGGASWCKLSGDDEDEDNGDDYVVLKFVHQEKLKTKSLYLYSREAKIGNNCVLYRFNKTDVLVV